MNIRKIIAKKLLPLLVKLDNFSYKYLTGVAIILNDGLHPKHRIMNYHKFFTDRLSPEDLVIDIGCGNGALTFDASKVAKRVVAIDFEPKNIESAKNKYQGDNLSYVLGDATTYNFSEKFDKIILSNVLEHIENRVDFLKKIGNLADVLLLRVPMIDREWVAVYKKENGLEYRLDPTHYIEFTVPILIDELGQAGWQIKDYSVQFGEFWGTVIKK
jgi:SAM-dependent methyltransferase